MQVEAVFRAALSCLNEQVEARPDIMIPLVGHANELKRMRELVERKAEEVLGDAARTFRYRIGTMIEVPRAAVTAAQIALMRISSLLARTI